MKFGKLESIEGIDFRLPPKEELQFLFEAKPKTEPNMVHFGATGWSMPSWKGDWYPSKAKAADFLYHYSRQFSSIELNTTHYRIPDKALIQKWTSACPKDFRFCPKMFKFISHSKGLGVGSPHIINFAESLYHFGEHMAVTFLQLPPYFDISRVDEIFNFLDNWPSDLRISIEFRHPSWFEASISRDEAFKRLSQRNVGLVITDVAGRRDVAHQFLTQPYLIIRFVGNEHESTDQDRMLNWKHQIEHLLHKDVKEIYLFIHQPENQNAPKLAQFALLHFSKIHNISIRGPKLLAKQSTLF